jgi:hypothetical protein
MKYKKEIIIGGSIVAAALIISFIFAIVHKKAEAPLDVPPLTISMPETIKPIYHKKAKIIEAPVMSYNDALAMYQNGHLIQFNDKCQTYPRSMVFNNNTEVMLDNRSSAAETVVIGSSSIELPAYGFKIMTLSTPTLPTTYQMSCVASKNVNTIVLQ